MNFLLRACSVGVLVALVGCGGSSSSEWQAGVFEPSDQFKNRCESPRTSGNFNDRSGSSMQEKMWLRSFSDETYLWYDEIPDQDPEPFSVLDYFDELVTTGLSPSGQPKDKFHFTYDTDDWIALSQSGVSSGYGMQLAIDNSFPRSVTIVYTEPNSPATSGTANIARGAKILEVDGTSITTNTEAGVNVLNAGLFPSEAGESHTFIIRDQGSLNSRTVTLVSEDVVSTPVQSTQTFSVGEQTVGYLLFNDHIATAESALADAVEFLSAQSIDELVVDLRYNGGGFLNIASAFAFMIAGSERTSNKTFELLQFNDKHPTFDPITGNRIEPQPFASSSSGRFSLPSGSAYPSLDLSRVYVLTGSETCSASESIINSLRGIDVEVVQIGTTTCGKPYGFYGIDNCGTTYFTIQFRGVNDKNFGDFTDGFSPTESTPISQAELPGCVVADDLSKQLGDPEEARLSAALHYIENGTCPTATSASSSGFAKPEPVETADPVLLNVPPWRQNRLL